MIKVTRKYQEALSKRNPAQQEAINALHGPVLVIAGPGTGKTDVLSLRIGNILLSTDATASNILCLTYTEAGASEMRTRLLEYIGPEANNVRIQTFHSFCNSVIQEHLEIFGGTRELQPVSDLEKIEIILEIIDRVPEDNPLRRLRGDIYYDRWQLRNLYDLMKQEGWSASFVETRIEEWLGEIKTREDFIYKSNTRYGRKGEFKQKQYEKEVEKMELLRAAVYTYGQYIEKLAERHRYDFADMLIWVRDAFRTNTDLLLDYQERFQYLLVDEFQDTNGIQLELSKQLTDYEHPNIFVVGDDDQAIYRFQGALVRNIVDFHRTYKPQVITLTENYRSSWHIIKSSATVIHHNRFAPELEGLFFAKNLHAAGPHADYQGIPRVLSFQNRDQELAFIAEELTRLHHSGTLVHESVAVIYRRHALADNLVRVLRYHRVPFSLSRDVNLLDEPLIHHLLMIMEYIQEQYLSLVEGDEKLFAIMHFRHFEIPPRDIARIADACKGIREGGQIVQGRKALRDLVSKKRKLSTLGLTSPGKVIEFSLSLEELCGAIHDDTPPALFERILHATGLLRWILNHPERNWYLQLVRSLMEHCIRESELNPGQSLEQYLALIKRHRENLIGIAVKKAIEPAYGIELITAHGAKGHEYDHVYMLGCTRQDWEDYSRRGNDAYRLPGNLVAESKESSIEDERRLFYVAMSRARKDLTITFARSDGQNANIEPSRFLSELTSPIDTPKESKVAPDQIDVFGFYTSILDRKTAFLELIDKELIDKVLSSYSLSATDFNLYLECPRSFYFEKILRIPSSPQLYFTFGNVIHRSLELLFSKYWDTLFFNGDTLIQLFEQEMDKNRGKFTQKEYENTLTHGRESLKLYQKEFAETWRDPDSVITEYKVQDVEHRGVPLKGYLDKVEIRPSTVHIIDYKTGKYENKKFNIPDDKNPMGGAFWRQMIFYKILLAHDPSQQWNVVKGIMDFVDIKRNKKPIRREIFFGESDIAFISDLIVHVYERIKSHDFDHKCDRWQCKWCELVESEFQHGAGDPEEMMDDG
ncbi:MAG TPA: ATP-dependent DNA helicase [Saprospiraceae bacterium]|nr:ATP-dependent DNA helicase [Saprospiraceae bacterium]